ncbi:T6SS immunity protein Tdi1 domain-containing protein [Pseudoclavibacter helvolus]|uniref:T6SS immunity protein Tdi1 domain-containing protein n=1 Tax=Pseudoclavibacter helvolus TaxID=255205 RepID=UPI003C77F33A
MRQDGYRPAGPLSSNTVEKYGELVPPSIEEAWKEGGTWMTEDGFIRLVDPAAFEDLLPQILPSMPGAYAVMATGYGDLFVVYEDALHTVYFRFGFFTTYGHEFSDLDPIFKVERRYQERLLFRAHYDGAVADLGIPAIDECLGFTLPLSMGGPQTSENLSRRKLREHLLFLVAAGGEPRHYDVVHPPNEAAPESVSPTPSPLDVAGLEQVALELFERIQATGPFGTTVFDAERAVVVSKQGRGGVSILVGEDRSVLYFTSATSASAAMANYRAGARTDPALFRAPGT